MIAIMTAIRIYQTDLFNEKGKKRIYGTCNYFSRQWSFVFVVLWHLASIMVPFIYIYSSTQYIIVEIAFQYLTIFADDIAKGSIPGSCMINDNFLVN